MDDKTKLKNDLEKWLGCNNPEQRFFPYPITTQINSRAVERHWYLENKPLARALTITHYDLCVVARGEPPYEHLVKRYNVAISWQELEQLVLDSMPMIATTLTANDGVSEDCDPSEAKTWLDLLAVNLAGFLRGEIEEKENVEAMITLFSARKNGGHNQIDLINSIVDLIGNHRLGDQEQAKLLIDLRERFLSLL